MDPKIDRTTCILSGVSSLITMSHGAKGCVLVDMKWWQLEDRSNCEASQVLLKGSFATMWTQGFGVDFSASFWLTDPETGLNEFTPFFLCFLPGSARWITTLLGERSGPL